jgi:hypothetical protein
VNEFIYERDGELFVPTKWAGGPWSEDAQHGAPPAGLFARMAEIAERESGLQLARLTIDLCKPVPRVPLRLEQRWLRRGRKLGLVEGVLLRGEEEIARASALLLVPRPELAGSSSEPAIAPLPPERAQPIEFMPSAFASQIPPGFHFSIQARIGRDELGLAAWITTPLTLVAGEPTSPQVRFGMLSDLTFAIGGHLFLRHAGEAPRDASTRFINADITIYRERTPEGEWLGYRPSLISNRAGVGIAEVVQFDRAGRIGRSLQALVAQTP